MYFPAGGQAEGARGEAGGVAGAGGQEGAGAGFQEHLEEEDERHQHSLKGSEGSLVATQYGGQRLKIAARIRIGSKIGSILCSPLRSSYLCYHQTIVQGRHSQDKNPYVPGQYNALRCNERQEHESSC